MRSFMTMKGYGALMSSIEIWKDIEGFEGLYQVSNMGRVRSLDRKDRMGRPVKGVLMKQRKTSNGYLLVTLRHNGKRADRLAHRLVAMALLSNPDNLPQINHKNEDKTNNMVSNLEWCDSKYNANYGSRNERVAKHVAKAREKPICAITSFGHRYYFGSIKKAAALLGLDGSDVSKCLNGKVKHHHGFSFEWASDPDD